MKITKIEQIRINGKIPDKLLNKVSVSNNVLDDLVKKKIEEAKDKKDER